MISIRPIVLFCFLFAFYSCGKLRHQRYSLMLKNNSEKDINAYFALSTTDRGVYPDTMLPQKKQFMPIKPLQKGYWDSSVKWEDGYFKELPKDTLSIYIVDKEIYDNQEWESVRNNYMILQRYDLSIYDLQKLDYTLHYPPTEAMRNMKMYPAYGK